MNDRIKIGDLEINLRDLADFIVRGKKNSYASGKEPERLPDGSERMIFKDGIWHYEDIWEGTNQGMGSERVWASQYQKYSSEENSPTIWRMDYMWSIMPFCINYRGYIKQIFSFLKKSLSQVTPERPLRGPEHYREGDFGYQSRVNGDIRRFDGSERIISFDIVYIGNFHGGLLIRK